MPIFGYRCTACGHTEDHLLKSHAERLTKCPACGSTAYERQLSAPAGTIKGGGAAEQHGTPAASPKACGGDCACH